MFADTAVTEDQIALRFATFDQIIKVFGFFARVTIVEPKVVWPFPILSVRARPLYRAQVGRGFDKLDIATVVILREVFGIFGLIAR
mmetsp:Transcript_20041/g.14747  ORF Transcript_20041/g.14747 Transcript_20041/m.14747 type:complete len:86 (+) Transcript_20041:482-739(+)